MIKRVCRKLAKTICMAGMALVLSNMFGAIQSTAASVSWPTFNSKGNIELRKEGVTETVSIHASDLDVIKNRIDTLMAEIK